MADYKTPGVYIEEISTLPASVAPVATAIPAFVGYTEKRVRDRKTLDPNTPVMISSLLEYEQIFGRAYDEAFSITLTGPSTTLEDTSFTITDPGSLSPYMMYYQVRMYFANGGGRCYIVSVGDETYADVQDPSANNDLDVTDLEEGINALEKEDEPTILVVPEAALLTDANDRQTINDALLGQCAKLQDRFAIMDVVETTSDDDVLADATGFRGEVGMNDLKYGAAYYPSLKTTIRRYFTESSIIITDNRGGAGAGPYHLFPFSLMKEGSDFTVGQFIITNNNEISGDDFTIGTDTLTADTDFAVGSDAAGSAENLAAAINGLASTDFEASHLPHSNIVLITAAVPGGSGAVTLNYASNDADDGATVTAMATVAADKELYNLISDEFDKKRLTLYPSGAMAGVYARVDRNRGVWKAPANVSLNLVDEPNILVTSEEQAPLNVDADTGKSINVIRQFYQKGTIVWGARTLAGNDNEWRYVPVRRLFIFIEESIEKASEPVVFEPNDANTWSKMKAMIENFLTGLWRDGALAGPTPEQAFFVKVGLGQTMSAIDILEGRLIIDVGIAAVRPAEFIILRFQHKLQEA
ncbi:phage tail sheath subtilisin-like domain-containing protein [Aliifodinibius sp. S!AR15-10]|uniref:phage tail sheath family protein n=1 Tax=Aliifodinibius sp. S!AR15-10 TaxID=2950437 RepID=UPI0028595013|nr:phage tail sheath C-terminal domain-containing protein [Aliifodinibius sp. S!AR15-10]MDR8390620.1 phage tail sheath subtilisin-like domain-containing protein [Aliifodinibius sp. S!AR15-10]